MSGKLVAEFTRSYPDVELDVTVTDDELDIVNAGFDAGVRLGENIEQDMVAIPISGPQRDMVVAAPQYLERHGEPARPSDLLEHRCIGWRPKPSSTPYKWEFAENGREFGVSVKPQITTNDFHLMLRTALQGGGITFAIEEPFRPYIEAGQLVPLLEDFLPYFPGFYLFYPNKRHMTPKLRVMVDFVKHWSA
ncbi:LysR substrate-binding domain-containing protein [Aquisalimonas lutea]|uniref:LysR substrate-binding domain-containing protein n=1 Tax=Aquisalimonas lutea TaxID=1327750 RepID=UPI0025B437E4|nr:LysR substrate-binding domain-containing protein [Aquisalimonas lutea]MDN3516389.1 LysR substrate-binding domain-containing protein [Aquisalimonas lutea]